MRKMTTMTTYTKIEKKDNWGNMYYSLPRKDEKIDFTQNQKIRVQWPNGKRTTETITLYTWNETVSDHGHNYSVTSMLPEIKFKMYGHEVKIRDLEHLLFCTEDLQGGK